MGTRVSMGPGFHSLRRSLGVCASQVKDKEEARCFAVARGKGCVCVCV